MWWYWMNCALPCGVGFVMFTSNSWLAALCFVITLCTPCLQYSLENFFKSEKDFILETWSIFVALDNPSSSHSLWWLVRIWADYYFHLTWLNIQYTPAWQWLHGTILHEFCNNFVLKSVTNEICSIEELKSKCQSSTLPALYFPFVSSFMALILDSSWHSFQVSAPQWTFQSS